MTYYINHSDYISHWSLGKSSDSHKYYARVDTGERDFFGNKKYRYFYTPDEYQAYVKSVDGKKNQQVNKNKAEFAEDQRSKESYNNTVAAIKKRYKQDNASDRKPTESERVQAQNTYYKKLSDHGRKTVDEQGKNLKKNSKEYLNLINQTYELEQARNYNIERLAKLSKNREANAKILTRAQATSKRATSTSKTVRAAKHTVNSLKNTLNRKTYGLQWTAKSTVARGQNFVSSLLGKSTK